MIPRLAVLVLGVSACAPAADPYPEQVNDWRRQAEARLKADDGWLTVAGLFWLKEGENTAGSGEKNTIVLPGSAPARVGVFEFRNGRTTFQVEPGVKATVNGTPAGQPAELRSDAGGQKPDVLAVGDLSMFVIKRGNRHAIRLRDKNSKMRREFTGRTWYPVDAKYRVLAKWEPYAPAKTLAVPNILGETEQLPCPGAAVFRINEKEVRLEPVLEGNQLFFIFKDRTAGKKTYGAGRFLYASLAKNGTVELDFNKAYNPPCAFTPYATCPLPPKQNQLPVEIPAGELNYHH
ncbi:MAG: DUF1684 domain-containing protein [Bryobacteraceae bacterium]|nr:DUF1684 domain-containing protein [Bryobacteraceae bacterium]